MSTPAIHVKPADRDDLAVVALTKDMDQEHAKMYGEVDQDPDNRVYTAESIIVGYVGQAPVGLCAWDRWENGDGKIRQIYVDPEFRRTGVAQMMVAFVEDAMRVKGITYLRFETGPEHKAGQRFWKALGYKELDQGFGYYADNPGSRFFGKSL